MLDLTLFSHSSTSAQTGENITAPPISRSRRPAILTYTSPLIDISSKISFMPLYVLGWKREAERLVVRMMEGVEFSRGAHNIPETLRLELNSKEEMQVYQAKVTFRTRFTGLRYEIPEVVHDFRVRVSDEFAGGSCTSGGCHLSSSSASCSGLSLCSLSPSAGLSSPVCLIQA